MRKKLAVMVAVMMLAASLGAAPASVQAESDIRGDYNGDKTVNIGDLIHLKKYLLSGGATRKPSDVDIIDGNTDAHQITGSDLVAMRRYLLGDLTAFDELYQEFILDL